MNKKTHYDLTNQEMWNDPKINQIVLEWIGRQDHPDYRKRIVVTIRALPWLQTIALLLSAAVCFALDGAKVSHIGAALIAFSTAITGICILAASNWNSKVAALNYSHSAMHPKRLYDRLKDDPHNLARHDRIGKEWFQYFAKRNYLKLVEQVVTWELFMATVGTALWGFADLFDRTDVEVRFLVCALLC